MHKFLIIRDYVDEIVAEKEKLYNKTILTSSKID